MLPAVLVLTGSAGAPASAASPGQSEWVRIGSEGRLVYKAFPAGDRIMDFSAAGYRGGGVSLPMVPVKKTVAPSGSDDTTAIQMALDEVARMELQDGFRGAVRLAPGEYQVSRPLTIKASGVVLRGSGSGTDGTILRMTGAPHVCFDIGDAKAVPRLLGEPVPLTEAYVPSGADAFDVSSAAEFEPGDTVVINRPATPTWVAFMGMNTLVRSGKPEHWVSGEMHTERVIKSISGNRITLEVPLADSFDARYLNPPGGSVVKCDLTARPTEIGVEELRIVSPPQAVTITEPSNQALQMDGVSDAWVRDLAVVNTVNSFKFGEHTSRLTIERVDIRHEVATLGAAKPEDFWAGGTQTLIDHCSATGDNLFYFSTGARMMGPVVVLNCVFHGNGHIQPHMRWGTGLLLDNCAVPDSGIDLMDRGIMGSGHGWTIGWSVAWNCTAKSFLIQQPPGSMNWAIGCTGEEATSAEPGRKNGPKLPEGLVESPGQPVAPASLYLAQLKERLGPGALANIGY